VLKKYDGDGYMTQKYIWVRREVYERNLSGKISANRSVSDMVKLFKRPYWIMFGTLVVALIGVLLTLLIAPRSPFIWFLMIVILVVTLPIELPREKYLYNDSVRQEELAVMQKKYQSYIAETWDLLKKYSVNTPEMVSRLKLECETVLKAHTERYHKISNRIFDMLIGVPLGALIASIIYTENNIALDTIAPIIIIGITISGFMKLVQFVRFYAEGYFKDKYLLDALNELSYSESFHKTES